MNAPNPNIAPEDEERPLDPATEKVRKKLVKFSAVFMGLNMLALMAVLGAIVYKIGGYGQEESLSDTAAVPVDPGFEWVLDMPDGARVISAARNGNQITITLDLPGSSQAIWFYDLASRQVTGKLAVE